MQQTVMTEAEFISAIHQGQTHFSAVQFNFPIVLQDYYEQEMTFEFCRFVDEVSLVNGSFAARVHFSDCHFHEDIDWTLASFERFVKVRDCTFHGRSNFRKTIFDGNASFRSSKFLGEVFFDHTFFKNEASFYKTQFLNNVYFHRTYMGTRADFSYATFSRNHTTSFFSVQNQYPLMNGKNSEKQPPVFIFRYVYFHPRTLFTNIDLSCTVFRDTYLVPIVFKNCKFTQIRGRNGFYQEGAKHEMYPTNHEMYTRIVSKVDNLTVRIDDGEHKNLQVGDSVTFVNSSDPKETYRVFVTGLVRGKDVESIFSKLGQRMPLLDFGEYQKYLSRFYTEAQLIEQGLVGFTFKKFDEHRHWENLEDTNRQMKRSLEDSRDWQKAGDFYVGEMNAMVNRLRVSGERPMYRFGMRLYGTMSGYCESVWHIIVHMLASFAVSMLILLWFRPDMGFSALFDTNFKLFIPVFGNNTATLNSLELDPWQNVVMEFQVVWYYMLWLFLALTTQRKFRR